MKSESTPSDSQPPPEPLGLPGRLLQSSLGDAQDPSLNKGIESLKKELASILKNTGWPAESTDAAEGLLKTIGSSPDISIDTTRMARELRILVERYIQVLDDVHVRLKDASSKSEMKRWKFLERIRSLTSNRRSKCTLLFQTCQDDILNVVNALNERLDSERAKEEDPNLPGDPLQAQSYSGTHSLTQDPSTGTAEPRITSDDSTPLQQPLSSIPQDRKDQNLISEEALNIARKALKSVEIGSGVIPVIRSYVGGAAKVGLAFVEMLQTMDRNDSLAIDLGDHTSKLTKLLGNLREKSNMGEENLADQINDLHAELVQVKVNVEEWCTLGRFKKAFSARDHAEKLKEYQETIQTAREEMQLLVGLDSRNLVLELHNIELRKERRRLLKCLGDGQYGARGSTIENTICFPGTRLEILRQIDDWIRDASISSPVLWICGMAGRGKSTIASTVAHKWRCRASCAIFHFRRGQSAVNSRAICTVARQLGNSLVNDVKDAILESVRENEDIAIPGKRLDEQFETLLVAPFAKLKHQTYPILIVLDALDECDNPDDAVELIRLIHNHSSSFPKSVKFLLTCRPEAAILRNLAAGQWRKEDLDSAPDMDKDIMQFLQAACTRIKNDHDLSEDWPCPGDVEKLVQMSQGLFQWARTAATYIGNGSPTDRLRALLKRPSVWSGLDDLYHQILTKAFDSLRLDPNRQNILIRVLGTLVVAPHPVSLDVIACLYEKHEIFDGDNQEDIIQFLRKDLLADLNSLLFIPDSPVESLRLMHTSIQDLLASELRCKHQPFYVDPTRCHRQLANACFKIMLSSLKESTCGPSNVSKASPDVQGIVECGVSRGTQYSCRAWATHLTQGVQWTEPCEGVMIAERADFESFSERKVMHWLEVMTLVGVTTEAISAARQVHQWLLQQPKHDYLASLWGDVQRFITTFLEPISVGPLHIYTSALPHCPVETGLWHQYGKLAKIRALQGRRMAAWPSNLWARTANARMSAVAFTPNGRALVVGSEDGTVRLLDAQAGTVVGEPVIGHSLAVRAVCFSPDGKLLASASADSTVRLWNPQTLLQVGEPLTGHGKTVWAVCFSPIGNLLASGSDDHTVGLWNAETRALVRKPLTGHRGGVNSVCFSPNGEVLASGSDDQTIRLWNTQTGVAVGEPLTGHTERVWSVCFSPAGNLLASGSDDSTVVLWDPESKTPVHELLTSHRGGVKCVCFLPNGNFLASGGGDGTIKLWDTRVGTAVGEPLTGHNDWVRSLSLSPDGKLLASASDDQTVRLWDPQAGATVAGSLNSHSARVNSVCFSPDGKRVVSTSDDHTIRIWDPQTGEAVGEPLTGRSGKVNSVCFSPDGKRVVSISDDHTIRLWDLQTGEAVGEPLTGHSGGVNSVCFSPDGKLLASGSADETIRLWNAQTHVAVGEPLTGHSDWVRSVCFSADGKCLASVSDDRTVRLWDPQTGEQVAEPLEGHEGWVRSVCFSPDGKYLASGSDDCTVRLWDPQSGVAVGEPFKGHSDFVTSVSFSSDGTLLLARCRDGSLATWDVTSCQQCEYPRRHPFSANPRFQDHWITFGSSRFLWLPPQYWNSDDDGVALFDGHLAAFQNGSLSILDVSQALNTLKNQL